MNRFRLRAWDKVNNKMHDEAWFRYTFDEIWLINSAKETNRLSLNDCVVMQCTGKKDDNGKLLYEGDIIVIEQFIPEGRGKTFKSITKIVWDENASGWYVSMKNQHHIPLQTGGIILIGNIFENPDLLNSEK